MRPWLFRKEIPFIGNPDVVNRNSEKMTLGKSVLIVKVFVIDPRSKSLGKSTALNGSLATILIPFKHISVFIILKG